MTLKKKIDITESDAFLILIMLSYVNPKELKAKAKEFKRYFPLEHRANAFKALSKSSDPIKIIRDNEEFMIDYIHTQELNQAKKDGLIEFAPIVNEAKAKWAKEYSIKQTGV